MLVWRNVHRCQKFDQILTLHGDCWLEIREPPLQSGLVWKEPVIACFVLCQCKSVSTSDKSSHITNCLLRRWFLTNYRQITWITFEKCIGMWGQMLLTVTMCNSASVVRSNFSSFSLLTHAAFFSFVQVTPLASTSVILLHPLPLWILSEDFNQQNLK